MIYFLKIGGNMKALITGASSGIGREMAYYLADLGYDLILVARRKEKLEEIKKNVLVNVTIYNYDLSIEENNFRLYEKVKKEQINLLINNAGFGLLGDFSETDLTRELAMIDLNIKALHILMKLFLIDFEKSNSGMILNVASSAGFLAGPYLSTYYATKNYVTKLSIAVNEELRKKKSNVSISVLCPGPVDTEFNDVAKAKFSLKGANAKIIAKYAIDQTLKKKLIIVPGFMMKLSLFLNRLVPWKISARIAGKMQSKKM